MGGPLSFLGSSLTGLRHILALETLVMWILMKRSRENWYQIIVQPQCGLNRQTTTITFSFSFFFVLCRNLSVPPKQFRSGPNTATHLYTALHMQMIFEYEWRQTVSAAPEMKMIVFLQDPVKMDQSLTELCTARQRRCPIKKWEIDAFIFYRDEVRRRGNAPLWPRSVWNEVEGIKYASEFTWVMVP